MDVVAGVLVEVVVEDGKVPARVVVVVVVAGSAIDAAGGGPASVPQATTTSATNAMIARRCMPAEATDRRRTGVGGTTPSAVRQFGVGGNSGVAWTGTVPAMRELLATPAYRLVWVIGFFQGLGFFLLINVPGRFLELGLTEGSIGFVYAGAAFVGLTLRPLLGRTLDVVRRRTVMRVAGVVNVVSVLGLAVANAVDPVLFGWFVLARGSQIAVITATLTYVADTLPPPLRMRGIAVFGLSSLVPIAVSNLVGDPVIAVAGYEGAIAASGAMALVAALLAWWLPALPVLGERARRSFWAALAQPDLRLVWFITAVLSIGVESLFAFMRTFVEARPEAGTLGLFYGVYGMVAVVCRVAGGVQSSVGSRVLAAGGAASLGVGIAVLAFADGPVAFMTAAAFGGIAHGVVFPILSAEVVTRARTSERGSAIATFTSIFDLSVLGLVPVVGMAIDLTGYTTTFTLLGATIIGGALIYYFWDVRRAAPRGIRAVVGD